MEGHRWLRSKTMPTITGTARPSKGGEGGASLFILSKFGTPYCFFICRYLLKHVFARHIFYHVCTKYLLIWICYPVARTAVSITFFKTKIICLTCCGVIWRRTMLSKQYVTNG